MRDPWILSVVVAPPNTEVRGVSSLEWRAPGLWLRWWLPPTPRFKGFPHGAGFPWTLDAVVAPLYIQFQGVGHWTLGVILTPPDTQVRGVSPWERGVPYTLGAVATPPNTQL